MAEHPDSNEPLVLSGRHFISQYEYVYVGFGNRVIDHVLHFEDLPYEFDAMTKGYAFIGTKCDVIPFLNVVDGDSFYKSVAFSSGHLILGLPFNLISCPRLNRRIYWKRIVFMTLLIETYLHLQ